MNTINLINTRPPHEHVAVYRWYRFTLIGALTLIVLLAGITGYFYSQLRQEQITKKLLRETKEQQAHAHEQLKELTIVEEKIKKQTIKLQGTTTDDLATYLQALATTIPDDTCLFTADIQRKKNMQLHGYTSTADSLKQFMAALHNTTLFGKIELSSLQPEANSSQKLYTFTLNGKLQTV